MQYAGVLEKPKIRFPRHSFALQGQNMHISDELLDTTIDLDLFATRHLAGGTCAQASQRIHNEECGHPIVLAEKNSGHPGKLAGYSCKLLLPPPHQQISLK